MPWYYKILAGTLSIRQQFIRDDYCLSIGIAYLGTFPNASATSAYACEHFSGQVRASFPGFDPPSDLSY